MLTSEIFTGFEYFVRKNSRINQSINKKIKKATIVKTQYIKNQKIKKATTVKTEYIKNQKIKKNQ